MRLRLGSVAGNAELCLPLLPVQKWRQPGCFRGSFWGFGLDLPLKKLNIGSKRAVVEARLLSAKRPARTPQKGVRRKGQGGAEVHTAVIAWRLFQVKVPLELDPGKDDVCISEALRDAVAAKFNCTKELLAFSSLRVVRKSFDARCVTNGRSEQPSFSYIVDVDAKAVEAAVTTPSARRNRPRIIPGMLEPAPTPSSQISLPTRSPFIPPTETEPQNGAHTERPCNSQTKVTLHPESTPERGPGEAGPSKSLRDNVGTQKGRRHRGHKVVVVGTGPAGLFAALALAEAGVKVVMVERGQPVEVRGRDIGALMVRKKGNKDSNYCYGEGGAGTWSDGKLTTRIGKNSEQVQEVLARLVQFGAPEKILVDGKPHLGTDRLVRMLQAFRHHLVDLGVEIKFSTVVDDILMEGESVRGVRLRSVDETETSSHDVEADRVVLAVGHSARDTYKRLHAAGVALSTKDFAVGFRVEHPQDLINQLKYRNWASWVNRGRGKVPVADYKLAVETPPDVEGGPTRGCYSFCMCPGGQVVPTSTSESELCVNGMSFSKRASNWANAALVVTVGAPDFAPYVQEWGPLAGMAFQADMEQRAAVMGGGNFVAPVQRVTDFLRGRLLEEPLPSSSYRLGVKSARLDLLYPLPLTSTLKKALLRFDKLMPGFVCDEGLLHGVETRTSAPVCVARDPFTFQSVSHTGLYPVGEGAGYAGGIVSAATDGMRVGQAIVAQIIGKQALHVALM